MKYSSPGKRDGSRNSAAVVHGLRDGEPLGAKTPRGRVVPLPRVPSLLHQSRLYQGAGDVRLRVLRNHAQKRFEHPNYPLFRRIAGYLSNLPTRRAVIDVGCGRGDLFRFLDDTGLNLNLTGVDLSAPSTERGIRFIRGDILETPVEQSFDAVISLAVIEHVPDVHRFVHRLCELCAPGGLIVIMTNHEDGLLYRLARLVYRLGYRKPCERLYSKHHLNHFNVTSLTRLLRLHDLSIEAFRYQNTPIKAVDIPVSSAVTEVILRGVVWGIWILGRLTRQTFLQVVVCRR